MTDEQKRDLVKECGLDWQRGYMPLFDDDPTNRYAVLIDAAVASERELWQKDAARLDWLETLLHRTEYQNSRRPAESVSSDMHFAHGKCNLYVRNLFGNAITGAGGSGDSVRAAIDAAIRQAGEKT
jgi:hypothetical protein